MRFRDLLSSVSSFVGTTGARHVRQLAFLLALSPLAGYSQTNQTVEQTMNSLSPPDEIRSMLPVPHPLPGGTSNAAISADVDYSSDISASAMVPQVPLESTSHSSAGAGSTGWGVSGAGWSSSRSGAATTISGFSGTAFGPDWKRSGIAGHAGSRDALSDTSADAVVSPAASGIQGSAISVQSSTAETTSHPVPRVTGNMAGTTGRGGFPDSTRLAVAASPPDLGNVSLFNFNPSLMFSFSDMNDRTFLNPSLRAKASSAGSMKSVLLNQKVFAVWKEYELGIKPEGQRNGPVLPSDLTFISPLQRLEQQRRNRSTYGIYGAAVAQQLSDEGILH
jgi:hypothetical protein